MQRGGAALGISAGFVERSRARARRSTSAIASGESRSRLIPSSSADSMNALFSRTSFAQVAAPPFTRLEHAYCIRSAITKLAPHSPHLRSEENRNLGRRPSFSPLPRSPSRAAA
jgi:hypothetical protein